MVQDFSICTFDWLINLSSKRKSAPNLWCTYFLIGSICFDRLILLVIDLSLNSQVSTRCLVHCTWMLAQLWKAAQLWIWCHFTLNYSHMQTFCYTKIWNIWSKSVSVLLLCNLRFKYIFILFFQKDIPFCGILYSLFFAEIEIVKIICYFTEKFRFYQTF